MANSSRAPWPKAGTRVSAKTLGIASCGWPNRVCGRRVGEDDAAIGAGQQDRGRHGVQQGAHLVECRRAAAFVRAQQFARCWRRGSNSARAARGCPNATPWMTTWSRPAPGSFLWPIVIGPAPAGVGARFDAYHIHPNGGPRARRPGPIRGIYVAATASTALPQGAIPPIGSVPSINRSSACGGRPTPVSHAATLSGQRQDETLSFLRDRRRPRKRNIRGEVMKFAPMSLLSLA